jgi:hypothetical protein
LGKKKYSQMLEQLSYNQNIKENFSNEVTELGEDTKDARNTIYASTGKVPPK